MRIVGAIRWRPDGRNHRPTTRSPGCAGNVATRCPSLEALGRGGLRPGCVGSCPLRPGARAAPVHPGCGDGPTAGFSRPNRTTNARSSTSIVGRPTRWEQVHFRRTRRRCQVTPRPGAPTPAPAGPCPPICGGMVRVPTDSANKLADYTTSAFRRDEVTGSAVVGQSPRRSVGAVTRMSA
jgi:hypothetical protein